MTGMRTPKWVVWVFVVVVVALILYGSIVIRRGFSTQDPPSALETVVARTVRNLSIPGSAKDAKNPYPATPENLREGREHFADHCATCHANDGSGNSEIGPNLYPKAPDMRLAETQDLTDGEIFYIINNGVRMTGMPGWAKSHTAEETWRLTLFVRHLPHLSDEEKKDMEKFNPKSADDADEHAGHDEDHHH
jgi:mono/diheme cytochrome c family protein